MFKKGLSVFLTLVMLLGVFSVLPATVSAAVVETADTGAVVNHYNINTPGERQIDLPMNVGEQATISFKEKSSSGVLKIKSYTCIYSHEIVSVDSRSDDSIWYYPGGVGPCTYTITALKPGKDDISIEAEFYNWDRDVEGKYVVRVNITVRGSSSSSSTKQFSTPKITKIENTTAGVGVTIAKVTGAPKYRVFYKTGNSSWVKAGDTTNGVFCHKGVKSGTKYTYTVRVVSQNGKTMLSDFNRTGWAITFFAAPNPPKLYNTKSGVKVVGAKVKGAPKYRVFRKTGSSSWVKIADVKTPTVVDKTAKNGVTYRYTLRCLNKNGKFISSYNSGTAIKCKR